MLKSKKRTLGRKYPRRRLWAERRKEALQHAGGRCEITGTPTGLAVDHVIPEKWVRKFMAGADPHILENLIAISPALHGKKWALERRLYSGDFLAYSYELRRLGFEQWRIEAALKALNATIPEKP